MADSPGKNTEGFLNLTIKIDGKNIPDTFKIVSLAVSAEINTNSSAEIVMIDGDMRNEGFPVSDSAIFDAGNKIQIFAGYNDHTDLIFEGVIRKNSLRITSEHSTAIINCLNREKATNSKKPGVPQIQNIAPALTATYGEDLWEFHAECDSELRPFVLDRDKHPDLQNFEFESTRTKGRANFQGSAKAGPGVAIELLGVGKRFEGLVFINSVKHQIEDGGWCTEVEYWKPDSLV